MTIDHYMEATGNTRASLARQCGMPGRTVQAIADKGGSCRVEQAELLVMGSKKVPALNGSGERLYDWHITYADLAAGSRAYLERDWDYIHK